MIVVMLLGLQIVAGAEWEQLPVCDKNHTNPGATWCFYRNPTILPMVVLGTLSDVPLSPECVNGTCKLVTAVESFETASEARRYKWLANGMVNGGFGLFELQEFSIAYLEFRDPNNDTLSIDILRAVSLNHTAFIVGGHIGAVHLHVWHENSTKRHAVSVNDTAFEKCTDVQLGGELLEMKGMVTDGVPYIVALVYNTIGNDHRVLFVPLSCSHKSVEKHIVWKLETPHPVIGRMHMELQLHYRGPVDAVLDAIEAQDDRTLLAAPIIVVHDRRAVSAYMFNVSKEDVGVVDVSFGDPSSASTVYVSQDHNISSVGLMLEVMRRFKVTESHGGPDPYNVTVSPSQGMWLTICTDSEEKSALTLISYPEWALFAIDGGMLPSRDAPIGHTAVCEDRYRYWRNASGDCILRGVSFESLSKPSRKIHLSSSGLLNGNFSSTRAINESTIVAEIVQLLVQGKGVGELIDELLQNSLLNVLTVVAGRNDTSIMVFGAQQQIVSEWDINLSFMNDFVYVGETIDIEATRNGMYLFSAVSRKEWELRSKDRTFEICMDLLTDPTDPYLASYQELCSNLEDSGSLAPVSFYDFIQSTTSCPPVAYCPSWSANEVDVLLPGYYPKYGFSFLTCQPGYFCPQGSSSERCPPGFYCPDERMVYPTRCENLTTGMTCAQYRLTEPVPCAAGAVCISPYYIPQLAPPGWFVPKTADHSDRELIPCDVGGWCALGRSAQDSQDDVLLCPEYNYCPNASTTRPIQCECNKDFCSYCPAGTFSLDHACPSGHYCSTPVNISTCHAPQYCPAGSPIYQNCPEGWYCSDSMEKHPCPRGFYCPLGTIFPIPCPPLTLCPEGTADIRRGFFAAFMFVVICIVAFVAFMYIRRRQRLRRKHRDANYEFLLSTREAVPAGHYHALLLGGVQQHERAGEVPTFLGLSQHTNVIDFEFEDLGLALKSGKIILKGVSGSIRHGRVTAVMGPSGAGKTTFLSTLSGKVDFGTISGIVRINGEIEAMSHLSKFVGFVPQEDTMLRELTVREILMFSAKTRLPSSMSTKEIESIVEGVIDVLQLRRVQHSVIGDESQRGISGGQRKRVNIGMELVAGPTVLFLDEPTSGLDATTSMLVCECLRTFAEMLGLTIVTVIHQPRYEIFTMFHDALLLGEGGQTVYLGPTDEALDYFEQLGFKCPEHVNPPDFFMDLIAGEIPCSQKPDFRKEDLFSFWTEHLGARAAEDGPAENEARRGTPWPVNARTKTTCGFFTQLYLFTVRAIVQQTRSPVGLAIDYGLVLLSGLFIGVVFMNFQYKGPLPQEVASMCPEELDQICDQAVDNPLPSVASLCCLSMSLTAAAASLKIFGEEKVVFWREASTGVHPLAYFLAKNIANIPSLVLAPLIFLTPFYQIAVPRASFFGYYVILMVVHFTATSFGILVSIAVPFSISQLSAVVSVLISMMFSGARPTLPQISEMFFPMPVMPYISFLRWTQEAITLVELDTYKTIYSLRSTLDVMGYVLGDAQIMKDVAIAFVIGIVVRALAFTILVLKDRGKQK